MSAPAAKIFNIKCASHLSELIDGGTGTGHVPCMSVLPVSATGHMLGHFTLSLDFEIANGQACITMSFLSVQKIYIIL